MFKTSFVRIATLFLCILSLSIHAQSIPQLFNNLGDPILGNPKGSVTLVEFFDYECSHCIDMAPVVSAVIKANPNLRVVMKNLPLRGPMAELAGRVALVAKNQGKFNEVNHALFAADQPLTEESIMQIAKKAGLNMQKLKNDLNSTAIDNQLQSNMNEARELQIPGTPAFLVGKTNANKLDAVEQILGSVSQSRLQEAIDAAGR
jgi:protein-disulfide isomerase